MESFLFSNFAVVKSLEGNRLSSVGIFTDREGGAVKTFTIKPPSPLSFIF